MIYLQPGKQNFDYPETKQKSVLTWKAGEAKWSPAGGKHIAEIVSDNPVTIVEVELKKPGDPAKKATAPLDPVKVDPTEYKIEFENDQVRVLHVKIAAGHTTPMHEHSLNRVVAYLTDQKIRVTQPDGKSDVVERKAGEVGWAGPAKHKEENLNKTPFEVMVVELKN
jgi:quercetin dioxygenase-like cupin family protein